MPTFEFTSPEGVTFEVGGPEGSTPEQAFGVIKNIPALASAITHVESGGNPDAVSSQGASGSMQIMPATFRDYSVPGQDDYSNDTHRRAAALRKIADDYQHFGGDIARTAAAYIGGRGAVRSDGTIRDDVADANGTTPAAYARMIMGRMGVRPQGSSKAGPGRGQVNPPAVDANAPAPDMSQAGPPAPPDDFDPLSSGGPEIAQALQDQAPGAGGGRGFVNPPAIGEPTKDVGPGESLVRGWVGAGGAAARAVALVPGLLGVAVDSVTNAITGGDSTTAQDAMFRQLVDPAQRAVDWAELKPDEKQGTLAKIAQGIGAMVQDLPQMFASGGLKIEQAAIEAVPTVGRFVEHAVSRGFDAMRPIMVKAGTDRAQQVLDHGGGIDQAVIAGTTEALATGMQGAQPMAAEGSIAKRVATGLPVGAVQAEANRTISNAASPDYMQQPFSPENVVVGAVTNAAAAGAMGHGGVGHTPDRIDLGYEPTTGKTPIAAAVQGMGEHVARPGPAGAEPARDHLTDILNAGSVEEAAAAAVKLAENPAAGASVADEIRSIRPSKPVDLTEGIADGADAEVPPVPAGAGGAGGADADAGLGVRVGGDGADVRAVEPPGAAGEASADAAPLGAERGDDAVAPVAEPARAVPAAEPVSSSDFGRRLDATLAERGITVGKGERSFAGGQPGARQITLADMPEADFMAKHGNDADDVKAHEFAHTFWAGATSLPNFRDPGNTPLRQELSEASREFRPYVWEKAPKHAKSTDELLADGLAWWLKNPERRSEFPLVDKLIRGYDAGDLVRNFPDAPAAVEKPEPYAVERNTSGSLTVRGDQATIREALGNLPPDALVPTKDGIQVATQWSDKAATLLKDFDPAAHADLNGKKVSIKVDAEDGTHATLKLDAGRALRGTDARERELERLRECVGRSA